MNSATPKLPVPTRTWLRRSAAAAALAAACLAAVAAGDPRASRLYEDALQRFDKKDYAGAVIQLKNALQIDKNMLPVHVLLGKALLAKGDAPAAEVALAEALRLGVNRAEVVVPLARSLIEQGRPHLLLEQPRFDIAGLPDPVQVKLLVMRAGASADFGDYRTAMRAIEDARRLDPRGPSSWIAEVPIRIRMRQLPEAQTAADKAVELAPSSSEAHYEKGSVAHAKGMASAAIADYDKALSLSANNMEARVSRAALLLELGRVDDAARDVKELKSGSPGEPRAAYLGALIAERQGNTKAARAAFEEVTALLDPVDPQHLKYRPQALMLGGLSHYALQRFEKAKPYLEGVLRLQPNSGVSKLLAQIYLREGNVDRAVEALEAYLLAYPADSQAVHLLASAHMSKGRYARAAQLTQDALRKKDFPSMRSALGLSLLGTGKVTDAVAELEAAYKKDPTQVQAATALATIYLHARQGLKARRIAERLVQQVPSSAGFHNLLGSVCLATNDAAGAKAAFEASLKLDPKLAAPMISLARMDAAAGDFDSAASRLNKVLSQDPKNVEAHGEVGRLLEFAGRQNEALKSYERADDHSGPSDLQAGVNLVEFLLRQKQPEAARNALGRIVSKAPDSPQVLIASARVQLALGEVQQAKSTLGRAGTQAASDPANLMGVALLQNQAGLLPDASYTLDKVLKDHPDFIPALALRAEVEVKLSDYAKAEARARRIVALAPKVGVGYALLGDVARARGQRSSALEHYKKAHGLEQSSESLLRLHSAMLVADPKGAAVLSEQWLRAHSRDVVVRRAQADAHARAGNWPAARASYEELLRVAPDDGEALNNLANVLIAMKDATALTVAERALAKLPSAAHVMGTAGWAAHHAGQQDRALQLLRDARLRDPANPETRFFLATALAKAGRTNEAREELGSALSSGRPFASAKQAQELLTSLK